MKALLRCSMAVIGLTTALAGCAPQTPAPSEQKTLVVTYSILGSLVKELVGDQFNVVVSMPNGLDPHEWEPSAKDIEALNKAALIIMNGEGLEAGMDEALDQAAEAGVPVFTASEHMTLLDNPEDADEEEPQGEDPHGHGAHDPHLWLDPAELASVISALAVDLKTRFGTDLSTRAAELTSRLKTLAAEIQAEVDTIPAEQRLLVTGHESLGYFAHAFGFTLIGAIVPSLTTQAEVSASDMANLKKTIQGRPVRVIFTEMGTPPKVAEALGTEVALKVVEITTHGLLEDGSYFTYLKTLASTIVDALKKS